MQQSEFDIDLYFSWTDADAQILSQRISALKTLLLNDIAEQAIKSMVSGPCIPCNGLKFHWDAWFTDLITWAT